MSGALDGHLVRIREALRSREQVARKALGQHFLLGAHPGHPEVSLAAGLSGHGFKFASVVGEILADLALDGSTEHAIGPFSPDR